MPHKEQTHEPYPETGAEDPPPNEVLVRLDGQRSGGPAPAPVPIPAGRHRATVARVTRGVSHQAHPKVDVVVRLVDPPLDGRRLTAYFSLLPTMQERFDAFVESLIGNECPAGDQMIPLEYLEHTEEGPRPVVVDVIHEEHDGRVSAKIIYLAGAAHARPAEEVAAPSRPRAAPHAPSNPTTRPVAASGLKRWLRDLLT
ncbi:MAG TPA: hypothetical protein VM536_07510 [Chloroflexia bacterium]|nr:hypothetical protein [Chloroflexia bacterium]